MGKKRSRGQPTGDPQTPAYNQEEAGLVATEQLPPSKKSRVDKSHSLFVRSLPKSATSESLTNFFSEHFPVKHATVVLDPKTKESRGYGFVTFADADDAKEAQSKLNKQKMDGRPVLLEIAETRQRQGPESNEAAAKKEERQAELAEARKVPKIIVRNLPWSIKTSDQLLSLFQPYGKVKYADLPQSKGKLSGFGFVTMRGRKNAEQALEGVNGKEIDGRTLAVDWAVDKKSWDQQQKQEKADAKAAKAAKKAQKDQKKEKAGDNVAGDAKDEDEGEDDGKSKAADEEQDKPNFEDEEDEDMRNFMKNHFGNLEEEDDIDDEEDDDDSDGGADLDDEDLEDDANSDSATAPQKPLMTSNDTTIFIRNLPFSVTDEELKAHFQQFGRVRYARIVMDRATDRPAGTGFVCFISGEDAKNCLKGAPRPQQATVTNKHNKQSILQDETADQQGKYTMDGRILQVSQAVSKDEASRLANEGVAARKGKETDKRRLFLLNEGAVMKDSPLYELFTPGDIKLRDQSVAARKKMIESNPSLHLSLNRLAVRNMPREMDAKQLKALAREAIVQFSTEVREGKRSPLSKEELMRGGDDDKAAEQHRKRTGKGIVRQAKVVYENKQGSKVPEGDASGRSRGYGFIEYWSHSWALKGLRWLNGHAVETEAGESGSGAKKTNRLIVEFAIENQQVVARRKDLQNRFRNFKKDGNADGKDGGGDKKSFSSSSKGGALPKGKDFSVSKGKRQKTKNGKPLKGSAGGDDEGKDKKKQGGDKGKNKTEGKGEPTPQDELQQKIIGRKRMVRKKKAFARSG